MGACSRSVSITVSSPVGPGVIPTAGNDPDFSGPVRYSWFYSPFTFTSPLFGGRPAPLLVAGVVFGIVLKVGEWLWLQRLSKTPEPALLAVLTWSSIALNIALASVLAALADREHAIFRHHGGSGPGGGFPLRATGNFGGCGGGRRLPFLAGLVVLQQTSAAGCRGILRSGINSLLFYIVGVWLLLTDLRRKETRLANNLRELERAREQLLREERLAAVGRFSSAIAHEIRNPVAMISSR